MSLVKWFTFHKALVVVPGVGGRAVGTCSLVDKKEGGLSVKRERAGKGKHEKKTAR